jgi:hypothetical protein
MGYARTVVDIWAAKQPDEPKRSEAIRRLVELGLKVKNSKGGIHEHRSSRTKHNDISCLVVPNTPAAFWMALGAYCVMGIGTIMKT